MRYLIGLLMLAVAAGAGFASGPFVFSPPSVSRVTIAVAAHLCAVNDGVRRIERRGEAVHTIVCDNGAHFLNVEITEGESGK